MLEPQLAFHNTEFLDSEEARPIRILAEYFEPLRRFKEQNIQDTVVFFGSARIRSREHAEEALARLEQQMLARTRRSGKEAGKLAAARPDARCSGMALSRARRAMTMSRYYEDARTMAQMLTEWTLSLKVPAPPLRRLLRRRPRHHGGRQPRRVREPAARASASTSSCRSSRA